MLNEKLCLIVGHTHEAPGASMAAPYAYVQEYEFYTVLAAVMSAQLRKRGVEHAVFFRDGIGIDGAYQKAKVYGPCAIIELHFNAASSRDAKGSEVLYGGIAGSKELAEYVHHEICSVLSRHSLGGNRGTKFVAPNARGGRSVNSGVGIPSILVEPFFGSNVMDAEAALENFQDLADAIIEGFMKWFVQISGEAH